MVLTQVMLAVLVLIVVVVGLFLRSYVKKKAENLATKEDIADITRRVEAIRSEYAREHEKLRMQLQISGIQQSALLREQRKALYDFHADCIELLGDKLPTNLGDIPGGIKELADHQNSIQQLCRRIYLRNFRLCLLLDGHPELLAAAGKVTAVVEEIRKAFLRKFVHVKLAANEEMKALEKGRDAHVAAAAEADAAVRAFLAETNPAIRAMATAFGEYEGHLRAYIRKHASGELPAFSVEGRPADSA